MDDFSKDDITAIKEGNVDADVFLELTKEILIFLFKLKPVSAVKIMKKQNENVI